MGASISDAIVQQGRDYAAIVGQQQQQGGSVQYAAMPALPPQLISGLNGIIQGLDSSVGGVQTLPLQLSPSRNHCAEPCSACDIQQQWATSLCALQSLGGFSQARHMLHA